MKLPEKRDGFSMLECMVAITATSILLTMTIGWIHKTMHCAAEIKQRQRHHQSLMRLDSHLRDEVRQGSGMSLIDESLLELTRSDGTTSRYTITERSLTFERFSATDDSERIAQERFEWSPDSVAAWDTSEMPKWISLVVSRRNEFPAAGSLEMPIDLQIRVSPDRWQGAVVDLNSPAVNQKEQP